jgi:hypothetical protein
MFLPASGGYGTRVDGMVNICERSINVVIGNEPKMLHGSHQNGTWRVQGLAFTLSWTHNATGGESGPNPFGYAH